MTSPNPTPTPLASTAMEAAREALARINPLVRLDGDDVRVSDIFQKHFQPLLAKVEGEKAAKDHVPFSNAELVAQVLSLRADLAAKEAALGGLTASLKEAHAFINAVGTEDPDDVETMAAIEQLSGRITAALASRADKGGAR